MRGVMANWMPTSGALLSVGDEELRYGILCFAHLLIVALGFFLDKSITCLQL